MTLRMHLADTNFFSDNQKPVQLFIKQVDYVMHPCKP